MRKAPSCIRVFVRMSASIRPGESKDQAIERLLPHAVEELRAKALLCGLLPADDEVEQHLEIETCCYEDEVEVRVVLFDRADTRERAMPQMRRRMVS